MADSLQYSAMFWHGLFTSRVKEIMGRSVRDFMSNTLPKSMLNQLMESPT